MNTLVIPVVLLTALLCGPVFADDAHPDMGIQQDIPVAEAIALLEHKKPEMIHEHQFMIQKALKPLELKRWRAQGGDLRIEKFVDDIHKGVIGKLENGNLKTVSAAEVGRYPQAFGSDIRIIMAEYRAEKQKDGRLSATDWSGIIGRTAPQRGKVARDFADRKGDKSIIVMLDGKVSDELAEQAKPASGGAGGGGGSDSSSHGAGNSIVFGDVDGAQASLDQAIKSGRADGGAYAMRGEMALNEGRYAEAYQDAQQALQMDPTNKTALVVAHFSAGRVGAMPGGDVSAAAGAAASEGFASSGSSPRAVLLSGGQASRRSAEQFARAGESALRLGDMGGAKAYADRGLAASPGDAYLLALRAAINLHQHEYAKAAADAKAGLESDPRNLTLLRAKAFAENRAKNWRDALGTANQILEINPSDAYGYAYRAHAYGGMGDRDAMMSDISRAAKLDPRFAEAAAQAAGLQLPSNADLLFLFPGEAGPAAATAPAPSGRNRRFGLLVGVSALGGLLLAFGLLQTVLAPLKEQVSAVFTKITRTGPSVRTLESPASAPGLISGQYEVSRQIGSGGMGMVFEGTDRSLGRRVAIKKMRDEIRADARERARFVTEAKTVAALHHPNIVDIYAIAEDGDDVFLVFEYVDGKTVHELVQAGGLDPATSGRVVREVASALDYAHARGIIHRDMKPSNVMVDGQGRVKVMDFGIARAAKDALTRYSVTNTVVGTPPYMAPEQEQGQVRRESDVYALAVCAYEMLTGKLPFIGTGGGMMLNKINMSYVPPSRQKEGLPAALDEVFVRAFQADPDKRYRTPAEFSAALSSALPAVARA